jgi:putative aldouronate transport system permease protein
MYPLTLLLRRVLIEGVASREMLIKIGEMTTANMTGLELSESELIQFSGGLIVSVKMANIMLAIGPIILLYPFVQRYFSKGTLLGSVKE